MNEYAVTFTFDGQITTRIMWAKNPAVAFAKVALDYAEATGQIITFQAVQTFERYEETLTMRNGTPYKTSALSAPF